MRNLVLALFMIALTATATPAQNKDWGDKLFLGVTQHDFGSVARGAMLSHKFKMKNIWAVPIELLTIRASCGCVTATPSKQVLQSREEGVLEVTMDARRFTGPKTVTIHILIGPEYTSTATLQVSANSRTDVVFNPGEINFGVVAAGQTPALSIDVEYAGALDWQVTEVMTNGAPLDVKIEDLYPRRPIQPGTTGRFGYRVHVTLKPDAAPGSQKWELLLKTNDPSAPHVPFLVNATVQASLQVLPATVTLGSVKTGEATTKPLLIKGSKPFRILAIEGLGEGVQCDLPTAASPLHKLTLKCQPTLDGEFRRQLRIKTDLDDASVVVTIIGDVSP